MPWVSYPGPHRADAMILNQDSESEYEGVARNASLPDELPGTSSGIVRFSPNLAVSR
jgi:hypothetical protein